MGGTSDLLQSTSGERFYSDIFISIEGGTPDPLQGIKLKLASLGIGTGKEDSIPESRMHHYQRWVDNILNSKLSVVYKVPLRRITRQGRNLDENGNAVAFFSEPIQKIATDLVSAYIVFHEYSDIGANENETARGWYNDGMAELEEIAAYDGQVGTRRLEGQDARARSIFVHPTQQPRPIPNRSAPA